jgi:hypothetical protein
MVTVIYGIVVGTDDGAREYLACCCDHAAIVTGMNIPRRWVHDKFLAAVVAGRISQQPVTMRAVVDVEYARTIPRRKGRRRAF